MATEIFFADFDGNGPGFSGGNRRGDNLTNAVFSSWSIGGAPISAGRWQLSSVANDTGGSGSYAAIESGSPGLTDLHIWMLSPLIDIKKYENLTLSADLYFKSHGAGSEDTLTISILTISSGNPIDHKTVAIIGEDMDYESDILEGNKSWPLSPYADGSDFIQLAFSWYTTIGAKDIQLDNIRILGDEKAIVAPPTNLTVG